MRYVGGDKKMLMIDIRADFKRLVEKIYYRLRINRRRLNVRIYMDNDLSLLGNPHELRDDDVEFFMLLVGKKLLSTRLYIIESQIEERDNLDEE